jgi:hypothetical protein
MRMVREMGVDMGIVAGKMIIDISDWQVID